MWTRQIYSLLHRCVSITLNRLKHRRFFTESALWSSYPFPIAVTIVQECGYARFVATTSPLRLHHAIASQVLTILHKVGFTIVSSFFSSHELLCKSVNSPNLIDTMSWLRFHYITPSQVSMVLHIVSYVTSHSKLCDPFTGIAIFYNRDS